MDLSIYLSELKDSLQAAASLGDDSTQRAAGALAGAIEPAATLAIIHALSDFAGEVTTQLNAAAGPDAEQISVDVRLDGRAVRVATSRSAPGGSASSSASASSSTGWESAAGGSASSESYAEAPGRGSFSDASGDLTRTTVRMFNELKSRAEKAAADQGLSLNSFISRAVADSMRTDGAKKWKSRDGRSDAPSDGRSESPTTISGYVQG